MRSYVLAAGLAASLVTPSPSLAASVTDDAKTTISQIAALRPKPAIRYAKEWMKRIAEVVGGLIIEGVGGVKDKKDIDQHRMLLQALMLQAQQLAKEHGELKGELKALIAKVEEHEKDLRARAGISDSSNWSTVVSGNITSSNGCTVIGQGQCMIVIVQQQSAVQPPIQPNRPKVAEGSSATKSGLTKNDCAEIELSKLRHFLSLGLDEAACSASKPLKAYVPWAFPANER